MYPYDKKWTWWVRGRHRHLVDGLRRREDIVDAPRAARLRRRLTAMEWWLMARVFFLLFLSFSLIASVASLLLGWFDPAAEAIALFRRAASATATVFTLAYLFTLRVLGQLEVDILMLVDEIHAAEARPAPAGAEPDAPPA